MTGHRPGRRQFLTVGIVVVMIGSLLTAAAALAGTKTITVKDTDKIHHCEDIDKVVANAGKTTTKFTITMAGSAKSAPCSGHAAPNLILNSRCNVSRGQSGSSVVCEGGGGGAATIKINRKDPKEWSIKFATKEAEIKGTTSFKFQVYVGESDSAGPATVKIG